MDEHHAMKADNIQKIRSLFSEQDIDALTALFQSSSGEPPVIHADRFRADHHQWLELLDAFEQRHHFIKRTNDGQFYTISPYALPLIDDWRAVSFLEVMEEIYQNLRELYQDYLKAPLEVDILIEGIEGEEGDLLDVLYYMSELGQVWSGKSNGFPYGEECTLSISESVLRNEQIGDQIIDYFDMYYINPITSSFHDASGYSGGIQTDSDEDASRNQAIRPVQPDVLGKVKWLQLNWRKLLKRNNLLICLIGVFVVVARIYF